jgi:hypothetical protein
MEKHLKTAVARAYDHLLEQEMEPGSDKWVNNTRVWRPRLVALVSGLYSEITGEGEEFFPFNDDHVARTYIGVRKLSAEKRLALR